MVSLPAAVVFDAFLWRSRKMSLNGAVLAFAAIAHRFRFGFLLIDRDGAAKDDRRPRGFMEVGYCYTVGPSRLRA